MATSSSGGGTPITLESFLEQKDSLAGKWLSNKERGIYYRARIVSVEMSGRNLVIRFDLSVIPMDDCQRQWKRVDDKDLSIPIDDYSIVKSGDMYIIVSTKLGYQRDVIVISSALSVTTKSIVNS